MNPRFLALLLTCASSWSAPLERWVYAPANHLVPKEIERIEALMEKARPLGFTHFLVADSKFSRLAEMDKRYFDNVERVKKTAARLGIEVVPAVFPVGYSNDALWHDPNGAEGLPVRDALFTVQGGVATVTPDPAVSVPPFAERKKWGFIDDVCEADGSALRIRDAGGKNARASLKVKVAAFRQYHASVRVKTEEFKGKPEIKALTADGQSLIWTYLQTKKTQEWTTHDVTFNSLDHTELNFYIGVWGAGSGTLWLDQPVLEECGAVNLLRREGCPLSVRTDDGRVLREGADFEPFADPRMGNQPWPGSYEVWHEAPPLRTKLPDGTKLRVSYYHPHIVYDEQICACVSEPKFMETLSQQAVDMHKLWGAPGYMMSHDEWRVLGWDEACQRRKLTPGQIIADNVRQCTGFLEKAAPGARVYTWSDMFDPHHNAVKQYYLCKGELTGAWEGLKPQVTVMNWNFDKRAESLKFFADRGHQQIIAGYYDADPAQLREWLAAARGVQGVVGVMYTTWSQNYADLPAFAKILDEAAVK